jgi:protease-4
MTARNFFTGLWRGLDVLRRVLHLLLLLIFFGLLVGLLRGSVPHIPARAALLIAPEGRLVEQLTGEPVQRAVQEARGEDHAETLLWDLTDAIHAAASDPRIPAIALDLEKLDGGMQPTLAELAGARR